MFYHCANGAWHFIAYWCAISILPLPVVEVKPLMLGLWVGCSTTVLAEHDTLHYILFCHFHSALTIGGSQTLGLRIMCCLFYHCANGAWDISSYCCAISILPLPVGGSQNLDVRIMSCLFYHCANRAWHFVTHCCASSILPLLVGAVKPMMLGLWVACFITVLTEHDTLLHIVVPVPFCHY